MLVISTIRIRVFPTTKQYSYCNGKVEVRIFQVVNKYTLLILQFYGLMWEYDVIIILLIRMKAIRHTAQIKLFDDWYLTIATIQAVVNKVYIQ